MSHSLVAFDQLKAQVTQFVAPVSTLTVSNAAGNAVAAGTLKTVKELMKSIEGKRVELVKPLNEQVNSVNEYAKEVIAPLQAAEKHIKLVMADFATAEQERAAAAQKKIDDERRASDEKAAKERQRLADEAEQRRKDEEAAAEKKRKDDAKKLADDQAKERKALEAKQKKEAAAAKLFGIDPEQQKKEAEAQRQALADKAAEEKRAAAAAAEVTRAAAAKQAEEDQLAAQAKLDREAKERESQLKAQERALETDRVKNVKKVAMWRIIDPALVPAEFWVIDEQKLGAAIRLGRRDIQGVEIKMENKVIAR